MQNNMEVLVRLGRFMISNAPQFADDSTCNRWARVGQLLTGLGMPFAPRLREFDAADQTVVREAACVMAGRAEMPPRMVFDAPVEPKRTRRARMTKTMSKPERKATVKATRISKGDALAPKRRGRPPGSKNKPKVVAVAKKGATAKKAAAKTTRKGK
jgi:hypothetical protein